MLLLILLAAVLLLVVLIVKKLHPMLALLVVAIAAGLAFGMPAAKLFSSINAGIGNTLGGTAMVLALGAMIGRLAEASGAVQTMVLALTRWFGVRNVQWAILCTGLLAGIPLFYNAGFVVLIPLVFAVAAATKLSPLYVGLPMAASLSVTHGFLPPHPGPVALAAVFKADMGQTLLYGLMLALPIAVAAGIFYARLVALPINDANRINASAEINSVVAPSLSRSFLLVLSPVLFIAFGTAAAPLASGWVKTALVFLQEPTVSLLLSLALALWLANLPFEGAMALCADGVKSIALIVFIIAAGGAFKQVLVESGVGEELKLYTANLRLSPLVMGWLVAAVFRVALGSATVAALTASGIVLPFLGPGVSPELMVISVGAGSLFFSHVNDTGFWMFKEYFGLSLRQTFLTWTVMESLISVLGLAGVMLLNAVLA